MVLLGLGALGFELLPEACDRGRGLLALLGQHALVLLAGTVGVLMGLGQGFPGLLKLGGKGASPAACLSKLLCLALVLGEGLTQLGLEGLDHPAALFLGIAHQTMGMGQLALELLTARLSFVDLRLQLGDPHGLGLHLLRLLGGLGRKVVAFHAQLRDAGLCGSGGVFEGFDLLGRAVALLLGVGVCGRQGLPFRRKLLLVCGQLGAQVGQGGFLLREAAARIGGLFLKLGQLLFLGGEGLGSSG